jgi:tetratricopeptide (TPR) repeat protein
VRLQMRFVAVSIILASTIYVKVCMGEVAGSGIESTYAEHTRAVELARRGQHEEGLNVLRPLLERFPDNYPLQRDFILITIWKGDCEDALQRFGRIRQERRLEPYFIVQVSHCLLIKSQFQEAIELIRSGLKRYPEHTDLQQALVKVKHTQAVELARAGDYDEGLNILESLLTPEPEPIIMAAPEPEPAPPPPSPVIKPDYPDRYVVVKGDTLWDIASRFLNDPWLWPQVWQINPKIRNPHLIFPGDVIVLYYVDGKPYLTLEGVAGVVPPKEIETVKLSPQVRYDSLENAIETIPLSFPDDYPLQRDAILITIWKGDCEDAVRRFHGLSGQHVFEPYFIVPVSDCLLALNRPLEAITLVRSGLEQHPEHKGLKHALDKAMVALRVDKRIDAGRPVIGIVLGMNESEKGLREWFSELQGSTNIAERTRLYARYLITRSTEDEYKAGELNRLGVGIRHQFNEQLSIAQAFSTDTQKSNQGGSNTELQYQAYDTWAFAAGYTTFAEDIPLRARANDIEAKRWQGSVVYDGTDYVWHWRLIASQYDFSDDNRRTSFFTTAGYAFEMLPHREQRLFLEWYQSRNTRDDAPYFNPKHDRHVGLVHKTDFVFESRFLRHVDHLYLMAGAYTQDGFGTHGTWGIRYERDYDFDETQALVFGIGLNRNIYDGEPELEGHFDLNYQKKF